MDAVERKRRHSEKAEKQTHVGPKNEGMKERGRQHQSDRGTWIACALAAFRRYLQATYPGQLAACL